MVQANEECDDGNKTSGDGCSAGCTLEKQKLSGLLDAKGIARVNQLEGQLAGMSIIATHPRIFLNSTKLAKLRGRAGQAAWNAVLASADKGDMISSALGYLMLEESNPPKAFVYAENVFNFINNMSFINWCNTGLYDQKSRIDVAMAALAFDWVYNGLSDVQRTTLINKLAVASDISAMKKEIDAGVVPRTGPSQCYKRATNGETFHREEWAFYAYEGWPEIALAGHIPDAEAVYKARWDYRWYWGDAARMEAYVNDGTPFEGYYFGNDGVAWFLALESATGINLIDGADFSWNRDAADYMLYRLDIANSRETMHKGVATSTLSTNSFLQSVTDTWKLREHISRSFLVSADKNQYLQWLMNNKVNRFSSWLMTNNYFGSITQLYQISKLLFYDQNAPVKDPTAATYDELPYDRHFDGGNEAYMRTGWGSKSAIVGFRSKPAFTMTSHSDFDVNTFVIYRDGPLSVDSGTYDAYQQQKNYFQYQKNTVAHNNLLVIDPADPDGPKKLSLSADPGGTDSRSTRTFSAPNFFSNSVFVEKNPTANWADIIKFESHPDYAYLMGDAEEAYGNRLSQYDRNLVFLRDKNDEAYLIIFDRVVATNAAFKKKWLLHTVSEPILNGKIVGAEVPGHIETYDGDTMIAENYEKTSKLHAKFLLPLNHRVRQVGGEVLHTQGTVSLDYGSNKVIGTGTNFTTDMVKHYFHVDKDKTSNVPSGYDGYYDWYEIASVEDATHLTLKSNYTHTSTLNGSYTINQGYQFWVDGTNPKNVFVNGAARATATEAATGKVWQHMGQGRIELMPPDGNKTDHFLVAMYVSDINSSMPGNVKRLESLAGDEMYGVLIASKVVMFGKTGLPINGFDFDVGHGGEVNFLITDLVPAQSYVVSKNTNMLSTITASGQGTIYFKDTPGLSGSTYHIQKQ